MKNNILYLHSYELTLAVWVKRLPSISLQGLSMFWQEFLWWGLCRNDN